MFYFTSANLAYDLLATPYILIVIASLGLKTSIIRNQSGAAGEVITSLAKLLRSPEGMSGINTVYFLY
jgi:hypothetical protein